MWSFALCGRKEKDEEVGGGDQHQNERELHCSPSSERASRAAARRHGRAAPGASSMTRAATSFANQPGRADDALSLHLAPPWSYPWSCVRLWADRWSG